jgi:1,4-alpha-glucan branching enzyme
LVLQKSIFFAAEKLLKQDATASFLCKTLKLKTMSIKKQFLKSKPVCKISFKIDKENANGAKSISVVGDFNQWDETAGQMKALKDGSFSLNLDLETGNEYQFRYFADSHAWMNEPEADKHIPSGFGDAQNSVISL